MVVRKVRPWAPLLSAVAQASPLGPLFAGAIAYTVGPHGLAAFTVVGIIIFTILFVLMPRIVAWRTYYRSAVATENPNRWQNR